MPGSATSAAEVTNISKHGLWLLIDGSEFFLPFGEFPWFKHATVEQLLRLERDPGDTQPVRAMFLAAHSIKGGAAMLGLVELREVFRQAFSGILSG